MFKNRFSSSLLRSASVYTITYGINSAIPFLLLPILTRYLTTEDYGIVAMFGILCNFVYPFTSLSVTTAIPRMYIEKDTVDIQAYVSNFLLVLLCSTVIVGTVFYFLGGPIARLASFPGQMLWIVIAVAFGQAIANVILTIFQVQLKPIQYGIYQILLTSLNAGLSIWFVIGLGMDWRGRVEGQFITYVVFVLIAFFILWQNKWIKFKLNSAYIRHALNFSMPLIPHALGGLVITMTDRVFLTRMVGLDATGVYTAGYQVAMLIILLAESFNKAYVPWLYARLKTDDILGKIKIVKMTYGYFSAISAAAIGLGLFAPWFIKYFLGKSFTGSGSFVLWIGLGFAFQGMYMCMVSYVYYSQNTSRLAVLTFTLACANIGVNYLFIRGFGAMGAAYSNALVNFLKFILVWIMAASVFAMPWNLKSRAAISPPEGQHYNLNRDGCDE